MALFTGVLKASESARDRLSSLRVSLFHSAFSLGDERLVETRSPIDDEGNFAFDIDDTARYDMRSKVAVYAATGELAVSEPLSGLIEAEGKLRPIELPEGFTPPAVTELPPEPPGSPSSISGRVYGTGSSARARQTTPCPCLSHSCNPGPSSHDTLNVSFRNPLGRR